MDVPIMYGFSDFMFNIANIPKELVFSNRVERVDGDNYRVRVAADRTCVI